MAIDSRRLFSADDTGQLICWDMRSNRTVAPAWRDFDKCEICDVPFFWNVKVQFERKVRILDQYTLYKIIREYKVVGVRRHHCRICGQSGNFFVLILRIMVTGVGIYLDFTHVPRRYSFGLSVSRILIF